MHPNFHHNVEHEASQNLKNQEPYHSTFHILVYTKIFGPSEASRNATQKILSNAQLDT